MRCVVDALWDAFGPNDFTWVGFYLPGPGDEEMHLGPSCPKPACTPIGLQGICGRGFKTARCIIVSDLLALEPGTVVMCDPKDRSEVVVPILDGTHCIGVLDVDSYEPAALDEADVEGLRGVLARAGIESADDLRVI